MNRNLISMLYSTVFASAAAAQVNTFDISVGNPVSPEHPATTIEVWARWDPKMFAFYAAYFDMLSSPDPGGFSDPVCVLKGPGAWDGFIDPDGNEVDGIVATQVYLPPNFFPDTSNPILLWRVTWSTTDFTPREVAVFSETTDFDLYDENGNGHGFIDEFSEASATITVVPAPASAAMLVTAAAVGLRRRR